MNNAQFRKLLETPRGSSGSAPSSSFSRDAPSGTTALGSKLRSSIPMTPRSVAGGITHKEFARQFAANNAPDAEDGNKKDKKFRSSAAPLGTRLPEGYVDRAKERGEAGGADDREVRLAALQELAKEGGMEWEEYVRQTKMLGGDVASTHLVKGLDFRLLEKVRKGEDVMNGGKGNQEGDEGEGEAEGEDVFDKALEKDVAPVKRKEEKKKGTLAPMSRAEILAELKRSREAAKPVSTLGAKFRKIGVKERKEENREKVKYVMGADGKVKKMVKKEKSKRQSEPTVFSTSVMGMMPPPLPPKLGKPQEKIEEDEDIDIFEGVGMEYDPLAGLGDDSSSSEGEEGEVPPANKKPKPEGAASSRPPPSPLSPPQTTLPKTNYFNEPAASSSSADSSAYKPPTSASSLLSSNPELAAALAKASTLKSFSSTENEAEKRRNALVEAADRDAIDIDFGFGGSRTFGDEDDDDGGTATKKSSAGKKRKRGGKGGKKGDKNDAGVVGKMVEERYGKK